MALSKDFISAVEEGNALRVKLMLKNSLLIDSTCQEFEHMFSYANERIPNLIDKHDGEIFKGSTEWDEEYYNAQTVKIVNNFSKERIDLMKNMVQKLYAKNSGNSSTVSNADSHKHGENNHSQNQSKKTDSELSAQKMTGAGVTTIGAVMVVGGLALADAPIVIPIIGGIAMAAGIGMMVSDKND